MPSLSVDEMRAYLGKSLSSINANKLNGWKAEIDFRQFLASLGYAERVSPGGWLLRNTHEGFGKFTIALFPHIIIPNKDYSAEPNPSKVPTQLHTICATLHQIGIHSYYCFPQLLDAKPENIRWKLLQLGVPQKTQFQEPSAVFEKYKARERPYNFLRFHSDTKIIDGASVQSEYSKENLRISIASNFRSEIVDIDGILWGQQHTYPVEIKEKTRASDKGIGDWFGIDVNPFVKMAFYAAKKGNLHSIFVVREIEDVETRKLKQWWFTTFDALAQLASWKEIGGGTSMTGSRSTVIRIPISAFKPLTKQELDSL